ISSLSRSVLSGSAGLAFDIDSGDGEVRTEFLYGNTGAGARLSLDADWPDLHVGMLGEYHAPYIATAEAIANDAVRDRVTVGAAQNLGDGLWGTAELRLTRYGVPGDNAVARTAGFHANLHYLTDLGGVLAGVGYDAEGEYVIGAHKYLGLSPTPF